MPWSGRARTLLSHKGLKVLVVLVRLIFIQPKPTSYRGDSITQLMMVPGGGCFQQTLAQHWCRLITKISQALINYVISFRDLCRATECLTFCLSTAATTFAMISEHQTAPVLLTNSLCKPSSVNCLG